MSLTIFDERGKPIKEIEKVSMDMTGLQHFGKEMLLSCVAG